MKAWITEEKLSRLADTIREKTGREEKMTPAQMAVQISSIAPKEMIREYLGANNKSIRVPETITKLPRQIYVDDTNTLEEVYIPDSVTKMWSVYGGTNLRRVRLPRHLDPLLSSVLSISGGKIESLILPEGNRYGLNSTTCSGCPLLKDLYVPWSEGERDGAPWGAVNAVIHYDYVRKEWE